MAIGSDPEYGVQFTRWGEMDAASRLAWYDHVRTRWGADLMGGYATVVYNPRQNERYDQEWSDPDGRVYGQMETERQEPMVLSASSV